MDEQRKIPKEKIPSYQPPKGVHHEFDFPHSDYPIRYSVDGDWIVLRKDDEPIAEIFFTAYIAADTKADRPLTLVFNGGPGASSAFLHVGGLGPKRVTFGDRGTIPPPPFQLTDNLESWLPLTDLIFIDPVGTGFSRAIKSKDHLKNDDHSGAEKVAADNSKMPNPSANEFYGVHRDLDSLGEFIQRILSRYNRWSSPIFLAGESYGGFRVAKLVRRLQEKFGVGLCGAIMISPVLELNHIIGSDYDIFMWLDLFPSLVASAYFHRKSHLSQMNKSFEEVLRIAEDFANNSLSQLLLRGASLPSQQKNSILKEIAALTGLSQNFVDSKLGRVSHRDFCRHLLKDTENVCGLYDASITARDPFPDRDVFEGPEPTLSIDRIFNTGINALLRSWLKIQTERDYSLLSWEANTNWKMDEKRHLLDLSIGSVDDLRYGMSLNPHMKVLICHGYFDLVTPYFATERLVQLMRLNDEQKGKLSLKHFKGGHMFYTWKESREGFRHLIEKFMLKRD